MKNEKTWKTVTLNLDKALYEFLEERAKTENRSVNDVIISILEEYVENDKASNNLLKLAIMKKISREEFKEDIDNYIEFASDESLHIQHNDADLLLLNPLSTKLNIVDEIWVNEFMAIPEAYRVNPFLTCDSGDLYWGDKRNIDRVLKAI